MVDDEASYEQSAERTDPVHPAKHPAAKPTERAPPGGAERVDGPGVVRENADHDATAREEGA